MAHQLPNLVCLDFPGFFNFGHEFSQLSKVQQFLVLEFIVGPAGGRQNIDARSVQQFFLDSVFAAALRELFVGELAIDRYDVRSKLLEFLREHDAPFRKIFSLQFLDAFGWTLHQIGEADAKFDHSSVVVIIKRLGHDAALVKDGPEFITAAGIVVSDADGGFTGIAAHDDKLHTFAKGVGEGSQDDGLLCYRDFSIFALTQVRAFLNRQPDLLNG